MLPTFILLGATIFQKKNILMHSFKVTETAKLKTLLYSFKGQSDSVQLQLPKMYAQEKVSASIICSILSGLNGHNY